MASRLDLEAMVSALCIHGGRPQCQEKNKKYSDAAAGKQVLRVNDTDMTMLP